ncbi:hypothetical protein K501DRAFT_280824 [Backusella circina FSU 941]|nr:hypothetical protein K501DRAFT_280824 [Backusella circina FSU 941]
MIKSIISAVLFFCFFVVSCMANCNCSPYDTACNSRCVIDTNHCVTSCRDDVDCYERCIDDKWPSGAVSAPTYNAALPSSYDNNVQPTYYYSGTPVIAVTTTVTQPVFPTQPGMIGYPSGYPSASHTSSGSKLDVSAVVLISAYMSTLIYYYY